KKAIEFNAGPDLAMDYPIFLCAKLELVTSSFRRIKVNSFPQKNGLFQLHHGNITAFLPI
ncbi:hypothetical protein WMB10_04430, partial [Tetragenococcus halophilus]|uniref:hypothetical protein n=1 Tax=Tetragenococcus halophilus TaxID=51669 RepID=UPI0030C9CEA8